MCVLTILTASPLTHAPFPDFIKAQWTVCDKEYNAPAMEICKQIHCQYALTKAQLHDALVNVRAQWGSCWLGAAPIGGGGGGGRGREMCVALIARERGGCTAAWVPLRGLLLVTRLPILFAGVPTRPLAVSLHACAFA